VRTPEQPASFFSVLGQTVLVVLIVATSNLVIGRTGLQNAAAPYSVIVYYVPVVVGLVATVLLARRGGYRLDALGWILTLAPLGLPIVQVLLYLFVEPNLDGVMRWTPYLFWFLVFARRDRQIKTAAMLRAPETVVR